MRVTTPKSIKSRIEARPQPFALRRGRHAASNVVCSMAIPDLKAASDAWRRMDPASADSLPWDDEPALRELLCQRLEFGAFFCGGGGGGSGDGGKAAARAPRLTLPTQPSTHTHKK